MQDYSADVQREEPLGDTDRQIANMDAFDFAILLMEGRIVDAS